MAMGFATVPKQPCGLALPSARRAFQLRDVGKEDQFFFAKMLRQFLIQLAQCGLNLQQAPGEWNHAARRLSRRASPGAGVPFFTYSWCCETICPARLASEALAQSSVSGAGRCRGGLQRAEHAANFSIVLVAGNRERLAPSATVVNSELFKNSNRRWLVQRDLTDGFSQGGHINLLVSLR